MNCWFAEERVYVSAAWGGVSRGTDLHVRGCASHRRGPASRGCGPAGVVAVRAAGESWGAERCGLGTSSYSSASSASSPSFSSSSSSSFLRSSLSIRPARPSCSLFFLPLGFASQSVYCLLFIFSELHLPVVSESRVASAPYSTGAQRSSRTCATRGGCCPASPS